MELSFEDRERFNSKFGIRLPDGCWTWIAGKNARGYGQFRVKGRTYLAHRVAFQSANGILPADQVVRHKCDNPECVNPEHLILGSQADNMRDMSERGRVRNQNSDRSHCDNGHPLTEDNILSAPSIRNHGWRRCRTCNLEWRRQNRREQNRKRSA